MRNPEETRNYIIETAAPVFNKNGYAGTSLSDILKQTPLTKGALYHHFANKDDLALAALEYNLRIVSERIFKAVQDATHSCDKLIVFAESFRKNYDLMKRAGGCPVVNAAVDSDDGNGQIRSRVCRFIRAWKKSISEIIERGKSGNEIKPDVNAEKFSMNFISLIEGSIAMSKVSDDKKFVDSAVDLIRSLVEAVRV